MVEKDVGFVLRRINFRETSIITTMFTRKYGKINGILKGFYSSKKEFTSSMDSYTLNQIVFYPKRTQIWLISFADLIKDFTFLRNDYEKNIVAAKCNEALEKIVPLWDQNQGLFYLFHLSLSHLEALEPKKILYIFFIKFLSLCGFKPELKMCLRCNKEVDKTLFFSYLLGGLVCSRCRLNFPDAYALLPETASSISYIQHNEFSSVVRLVPTLKCEEQILTLLDRFLSYYLHFKLLDKVMFLQ